VHLVGFIIGIYHDARSPERQIRRLSCFIIVEVSGVELAGGYTSTNCSPGSRHHK